MQSLQWLWNGPVQNNLPEISSRQLFFTLTLGCFTTGPHVSGSNDLFPLLRSSFSLNTFAFFCYIWFIYDGNCSWHHWAVDIKSCYYPEWTPQFRLMLFDSFLSDASHFQSPSRIHICVSVIALIWCEQPEHEVEQRVPCDISFPNADEKGHFL